MKKMAVRHFLDLDKTPSDDLYNILDNGHRIKAAKYQPPQLFRGLSLALVFDKRSTRTRLSFEVAMKQLGGHTVVMQAEDMQMSGSESLEDTAQVLSRFVDAVMMRFSHHQTLEELSGHMHIPLINGLTDHSHPCQIMADMMTIQEKCGKLDRQKVAWLGDFNNVARTWAQAANIFGFDMHCAVPKIQHREIPAGVMATTEASQAVSGASVVVTDTWVSMGQEGKTVSEFKSFQVSETLMSMAAPNAIFMHCMPVHRGEEVTEEVLASPRNVMYDEAENRLHVQKAILAWCLQDSGVLVGAR